MTRSKKIMNCSGTGHWYPYEMVWVDRRPVISMMNVIFACNGY